MQDDILGKWNYGNTSQFPYGDETSYKKAIDFLDGPGTIEDWGCGTAWARKFVKQGRYVGIDGTQSLHCDLVADLRTYQSDVDAILIRHILEHNWEWRKILKNAVSSFRKRFALVLFTPFSPETRSIGTNWGTVPDLSFKKDEILEYLKFYPFTEETLQTSTQYGVEHIFYVTRLSKKADKTG